MLVESKKKILIVNNNLDTGGIQKALVNLLKGISCRYDVTLLLFSRSGKMLEEVPEGVTVVSPGAVYQILGLGKAELKKKPLLAAIKLCMKEIAKRWGKPAAMAVLGLFQRKIRGYDLVLSFSHLTGFHSFDNGCGEFVLKNVDAPRKACMIHCDYGNAGFASEGNNRTYRMFDDILCVSDSVRKRFLEFVPDLEEKTFAIRNFYDLDITEKAREREVRYDPAYINLLMVARLSPEKGIDRAITALAECGRQDVMLHIVGSGPQLGELKRQCVAGGLERRVVFYGEQSNPYPFMRGADYLLLSSFHEAAPMVYDEAHVLSLPILSVEVLSAREMLTNQDILCENSTESITESFRVLTRKERLRTGTTSNETQLQAFVKFIERRIE